MATEENIVSSISTGQFETLLDLTSSPPMQTALIILIVGIIAIFAIYRSFSKWTASRKFSHIHPDFAEFIKKAMLPVFAIILITSINAYVQVFELFDEQSEILAAEASDQLTPSEVFAKILSSMNIFVIGYTISQIIPILITKYDRTKQERIDFDVWKRMSGFADDDDDFFHRVFEWIPPKESPQNMARENFEELLKTKEGKKNLEQFRTARGFTIGSYKQIAKDPFNEWEKSEKRKYSKYLDDCITGNNHAGQKLRLGADPQEVYPFDIWMEQKRLANYDPIIPGGKPPGWAQKRVQDIPKSFRQWVPLIINLGIFLGIIAWWEVDLIVLATATGGLAIGVGLALKDTIENYFAYILIRKDRIFLEGDIIEVEDYRGHVHKISPRVTYIRHLLNESLAIIPTKQLVSTKIINYTKDFKLVPAEIDVGVSYLNDPEEVTAIMIKIGRRAMREITDKKGKHLIVQERCPYLDENKPSCGCDKDILVEIDQPKIRFKKFDDSALYFLMWVYVYDFTSQYQVESEMRMIMYKEFKKYDIRIPWPIRTVYQGDEKRESEEISKLKNERQKVLDEFGVGNAKKEK